MVWKQELGPDATPAEMAVFNALDDPQWSWRTPHGIAESAGLDVDTVKSILLHHRDLIRINVSKQFGPIFQLIERNDPPEEKFVDKALDYLSMGRRRIA
jgi:hypothetical protein